MSLHQTDQGRALQLATARRMRALTAKLARSDPNEFCAFVLRDEETGRRIQQAPMHRKWHRLVDEHDMLVFWSHVEGGKTNQLPIGRTLYALGRNPRLRVAIVSNTSAMAEKIVRSVGQYIEKSGELHDVFPHLMPAKDAGLPWTSRQLTIQRPGIPSKDPSVQSCGVHGNIQGSRIDLLFLDDVLDYENTRTPTPREDLWRWLRAIVFPRLTTHARVIAVGNAWHPEDALHRLEKEPGFHGYRFPVVDPAGNLTWPERWPLARIDKQRERLGPLEFARQMLCQARNEDAARFKREWIDKAKERGAGLPLVYTAAQLAAEYGYEQDALAADAADRLEEGAGAVLDPLAALGIRIYTGVDLAVQQHAAADLTSFFTLALLPNGDRRVLCVESGRWAADEIIARIEDHHERYHGTIVVENVGAQDYILQITRKFSPANVLPFTTGRTKAHPEFGVEGLGAELSAGRWIIPNEDGIAHAEVDEWIRELLFYEPPPTHTGDRLMASWFAREGARAAETAGGSGVNVGVRIFGV